MNKLKDTLDNLDITQDEIKKLSDAFKNEEFKKLFREYAEELQDPENKKKYEEELTAMENERGMNVEFINPIPGHVIKTIQNGEKKVFVNICTCDKINPAKIIPSSKKGIKGAEWSIPHSFSPPREDIDKKKDSCLIYDVIFHPETYEKGKLDSRFRQMLHDTALQGIEATFKVSVDKANIRILKMKMKGCPTATIIRKKKENYEELQKELQEKDSGPLKFPYPNQCDETETLTYNIEERTKQPSSEYTRPKHTIKYCDEFDIANYVGEQIQHNSRPKKMVVEVMLPLISSANSLDLDINDIRMTLTTEKPVKYKFELKFTYQIISEKGNAKFDKSTRILKLELPIVQLPEEKCASIDDVSLSYEKENLPKNTLIDDSFPVIENFEKKIEEIKKETVENEPERRVPNISLRSRNNDRFIFLVCDIKNVNIDDINVICGESIEGIQEIQVTFSTSGQGGWKTYYKLPLKVIITNSGSLLQEHVFCRASKHNITIRLCLESVEIYSVSYQDQIIIFEKEDIFSGWKNLELDYNSDKGADEDDDTFNIAYEKTSQDVLKIICAPLGETIDISKEFPVDNDQLYIEEDKDKGISEELKFSIESEKYVNSEIIDNIRHESKSKDDDLEKHIQEIKYVDNKGDIMINQTKNIHDTENISEEDKKNENIDSEKIEKYTETEYQHFNVDNRIKGMKNESIDIEKIEGFVDNEYEHINVDKEINYKKNENFERNVKMDIAVLEGKSETIKENNEKETKESGKCEHTHKDEISINEPTKNIKKNVTKSVSFSDTSKINLSKEKNRSDEIEGLVSSEFFADKRDGFHRTYCAVNLDENLLFDLE